MIMEGWIVYSHVTLQKNTGNHAFEWMEKAAREAGLSARIIFWEELEISIGTQVQIRYQNRQLELPTFVLIRGYYFELSYLLEQLGVIVFNTNESMRLTRNKWFTHVALHKAGLPQPLTLIRRRSVVRFDQLATELGAPFVAKGLLGSGGDQVALIHDADELANFLKEERDELIFQEFIAESTGRDIRVHVIGGRAVVGIERIGREGDFRSNFSLGGDARPFELTEEAERLSVLAAQTLGLDIVGVDLLFSDRGLLVCEVNANAAFRTVAMHTSISIPHEIFAHIRHVLDGRSSEIGGSGL